MERQPASEPTEEQVTSAPVADGGGDGEGERVIRQENVGRANMEGGGEWPDPRTPPRAPAPGAS